MMLIKTVPTGRPFGDKREPERRTVSIDGVKLSVIKDDRWEGPTPEGDRPPQYWRMTWLEQPKVAWP